MPLGMLRELACGLRMFRPATADTGTIIFVNCPPLGSTAFRRYLSGLARCARGGLAPLAAHVAVNGQCPNRCARCSNVAREVSGAPLAQLKQLLAGLKNAGVASISLTGGEPLLRPDLPEIVRACGPEAAAQLFTSGHGLSGGLARHLRGAGLAAAFVSLDHFRETEHDRLRGRRGAFREALHAVESFLEAGVYTALQTVVEPALLEDGTPERFLEFAAKLGVHDVVLLTPFPVGVSAPCAFDGSVGQRLKALHLLAARNPRWPKVTAMPLLESAELLACQAGRGLLYVSAAGDVFPCDFVPVSFGNVFETGLDEILARLRNAFGRPSHNCLACQFGHELSRPPAAVHGASQPIGIARDSLPLRTGP
jgi:MoaA/NifB/PqqE/SkfB family radical SAM enzyme